MYLIDFQGGPQVELQFQVGFVADHQNLAVKKFEM